MVGDSLVRENGIIERVVRTFRQGLLTAFSETPVFIFMGGPGTGKDTLSGALNNVIFGHDGTNLMFSLSNKSGRAFDAIFEGEPGSTELPLLVQGLKKTPGNNGFIVLNEAKDLLSVLFENLKTIVETGKLRPVTLDSRPRELGLSPIVIQGQWGEELFEGLSDDEAEALYNRLQQSDLIEILKKGKAGGKFGAVPEALIQRALRTGGIFMFPPALKRNYPKMVRANLPNIHKKLKQNKIELNISSDIETLVSKIAIVLKNGTRGILGILTRITIGALENAYLQNFPTQKAKYSISVVDQGDESLHSAKVKIELLDASGTALRELTIPIQKLLNSDLPSDCVSPLVNVEFVPPGLN
jgi:hypothetical protein